MVSSFRPGFVILLFQSMASVLEAIGGYMNGLGDTGVRTQVEISCHGLLSFAVI